MTAGRPHRLVRLRWRLLLLATIAALPLAVVFGFALRALLQQQAAATERAALDLTRALATAVDNELRLSVSALEVLALAEPMGATDPAELGAARGLAVDALRLRPEWRALILSRLSGEVVVGTGSGAPVASGRVVEPASLGELARSGAPTIGSLAVGPGGNPGIPIRVPVVREGRVRYALTAVLRPDAVSAVITLQKVPDDWVVSVFDGRLQRVARSRMPVTAAAGPSDSLRSLVATLGAGGQAFGSTVTVEGGEAVHTAVMRLRSTNWIVALGVPTALGESSARGSALAYGAGLVLSVALGGVALTRVSRRIEEPIQRLTESAVALGRGESVAGVPSDIAELAAMSGALVVAADQRARSAADRESLLAAERAARTSAEQAQRRMRLLVGAGSLLSESLEESSTLNAIAALIVPDLADACRIDLLDAGGTLQRKITYHVDPERRAAIERFVAAAAAPADNPGTFPWAIRTGQTYLADFPSPDEPPFDDPRVREFVRLVGIRSVFVAPLRARGQTLGAIAVMQADSGRRLTPDDAELIVEIAQRAALALDNVRLFAESRAALHDASVANRAKDEFLAMLGHELRNPLAPIVTSLESMALRGDAAGARERWVIERQVRHLSRLVDDLLDVSRIANGKVHLQREVVDLRDVVARALELTQPALEGRSPPAVEAPDNATCLVDGDPTRLTQVVCNLLINAAKFSERDGPIAIALRREERDVVLTVRDEGIGIAPEVLPTIFERFAQGDRIVQRSKGGLGLGLAIARNLVELHGGTIDAESAGKGRGSLFTVRLPAAAQPAAAPPPAPAPPPADGKPKRLLVVDDNTDAAEALATMLELDGHEVRIAADGRSALALLEQFVPDVALLDIGLPDMSGYDLARRMRADGRWRAVGLVALTGYGRDADRARALDAGFDIHLVKPTEFDDIVGALARFG